MNIKKSGVAYSQIVSISEKLKELSKQTGQEYLFLQRGINAVCLIDLSEVVKQIDFNSPAIQFYPLNRGRSDLRQAINNEYFNGKNTIDKLLITPSASTAIDLTAQILNVRKYFVSTFYWGTYIKILSIRNQQYDFYDSYEEIRNNLHKFKNSAVIICDPNNPLGDKVDDEQMLDLIYLLNQNNIVVIFDSPYRKLFINGTDTLYEKLMPLKNVIIIESFSKSVGLSGQRAAFLHCNHEQFINEANIRLLFETAGTNTFAQILIRELLTTPAGRKAVDDFKKKTVRDITKNIDFLYQNNLLATELFNDTEPIGIFTVVRKTEEELLQHRIGSVSLQYFTKKNKEQARKYARICASVPHDKFVHFFEKML